MALIAIGLVTFINSTNTGLSAEPISPDGLLVTNLGTVRATSGLWRVWVTLDTPSISPVLTADIANLKEFVSLVNSSLMWKQGWQSRIQAIEKKLQAFPSTVTTITRVKRGLFDPLGYVIHKVFGLATDGEVQEIQNVLASLNNDDKVIINRMDMLTSIVNRSRSFLQENCGLLKKQAYRLSVLQMMATNLEKLERLSITILNAERMFEDIEHRVASFHDLIVLYAHRRQDLHSGRLTEELLPTTVLNRVLFSATTYDMVSLPSVHWYYEHIRVKPMISLFFK